MKPLILIPARMASTRLPNKPLADICGLPMIVHVLRRAEETGLGPVAVAAAEPEIVEAVQKAGGKAVLTNPNHPSGSDRIFEALNLIDPDGIYDSIVNVQGDLPTVEPETIRAVADLLQDESVDIGTAIAPIDTDDVRFNPAVVKAVVELPEGATHGRALYFSRTVVPHNPPHWHHIGLYAYRRSALQRFVAMKPSALEMNEKLEQLRALSAGMRIEAAVVAEVPLGVDTPAELALAREWISTGRKTHG